MKISADTRINNIGRYNLQKTGNKIQDIQYKTADSILNNSLSEAIGRSQVVSFCGENKMEGSVFEHDCSEFLGDKEKIIYNKENGSFIHTVSSKNGLLKKKDEFYPSEGREVCTRIRNGIKSVITKTPEYITTEKTDEQDRQIYYDYSDNNGDKKTVITEFDENRRIIKVEHNGETNVAVVDLRTNSYVTDGDIVLKRYSDKKSDSYITENMITGQIVKVEKYRPNGDPASFIEYSQITGCVIRNLQYNERTGGYIEHICRDDGTYEKIIKTSKNKREIEEYEFANDGRTETAHVLSEYDRSGNLQYETVYVPGSDKISTFTEYEENGCLTYYYGKTNNVPERAEHHIDGKLTEELIFWKDGESIKQLTQYKKDGSKKDTFYNQYGRRKYTRNTDSEGFAYCYAEYNTSTGRLFKKTEINKYSFDQKETTYDDYSGAAKRETIKTESGALKQITNFYGDGKTPKTRKVFYSDGSYTYIKYDEDGQVSETAECNADGTERTYKYSYYSAAGANGSSEKKQQSSELSKDDFMKKMLHNLTSEAAGSNISSISDSEWKRLSEYLGVENKDSLINMDKTSYRNLSKKFHPDLQPDELKDSCEVIFKIVSVLYSRSQAHG